MRIIGGKAKGRQLKTPKGLHTRPTQDRIRESIFNVLMNYGLENAQVLDLFAGTGALGLEALSRGARCLVAVDNKTSRLIKENAEICGFSHITKVLPLTVQRAVPIITGQGAFDYIFSDPPYNSGLVSFSLKIIEEYQLLADNGMVILEHHKDEEPVLSDYWIKVKEQKYDYTRIVYLENNRQGERS